MLLLAQIQAGTAQLSNCGSLWMDLNYIERPALNPSEIPSTHWPIYFEVTSHQKKSIGTSDFRLSQGLLMPLLAQTQVSRARLSRYSKLH